MTDTQIKEQAAPEAKIGLAQEMLNMANEMKNEPKQEKEDALQEEKQITNEVPEQEEEEVTDNEEVSEEVKEEDDAEFPLIPKDFSKEEREAFQAALDSEDEAVQLAAAVLIERYESLKKGFYNKTGEIAKERKEIGKITEVFEPLQDALKASGLDNASFTKALVNEYIQFNNNPKDKIKNWIKEYNLKPSDLGFEDFYDFEYNEKEKVEEVKKQNPQMTEEQIRNATKIAQFAEATDTQGKPLHPYFDEVRSTMGLLIGKNPNLSLKEAYNKAILIEGKKTNEEPEETEFKTDFEAIRERMKKAKKASKAIKTSSSKPDFSNMSIAEELRARSGQ